MVVHLFGQMAAMEEILPIAGRHGLPVIEDAAQSIGARRKIDGPWRMSGELGTVGTLSFFPTKNLGAWGDGGHDRDPGRRAGRAAAAAPAARRGHGSTSTTRWATNSRLDTLQAAVLLAKLPHLAGWNEARAAERRPLQRRRSRPPGDLPAEGGPGQRAHLPPVHHPGAAAGRAAGAPQGQGHRPRGLLSAGPPPAAVLRAPGLPAAAAFR